MKEIIIKEIHLLNFKGLREEHIRFDGTTVISGANGVGKSTVFDAFCWVMFGKNSSDMKTFSIKTNGVDGKPIPHIPHEVKAVLSVNGQEVTLRRCYLEKWTRKRGESTETFTGHTEERYYNDVPCSVEEYAYKVREICPEEVFKFITCPSHFPTRKEDQMRQLLFEMAGEVSDRDVADGHEDFAALLDSLSGKTMEEYKKEIQNKKHRIQAGIETIPGRIDERKRDLTAPEDTAKQSEELAKLKAEHERTRAQLHDVSKAYAAAGERRMELVKHQQALKEKRMKAEGDIRMRVMAGYRSALGERRKLESDLASAKADMARVKLRMEDQNSLISRLTTERERLLDEWRKISADIKNGMAPASMMDESQFVCPTCGRRYEVHEIEERQKEITERYLNTCFKAKEENQRKGIALKAKMRTAQDESDRLNTELGHIASRIAELQTRPELSAELVEPDPTGDIRGDALIIELDKEIAKIEKEMEKPVRGDEEDKLNEKRLAEMKRIEELQDFISRQDQIAKDNRRNNERIAELEDELRSQNEEKARLEGIEFTMQAFSKARTRAIEDKVNAMFSLVRFKLFDTQVNGAEVECCVPMVNGVPYPDVNTAGKVNAGLDIINTIVKKKGVTAPVFIDGAESVNQIRSVSSQLILLKVTQEKRLTVNGQVSDMND
jgi:hypothetical protein